MLFLGGFPIYVYYMPEVCDMPSYSDLREDVHSLWLPKLDEVQRW